MLCDKPEWLGHAGSAIFSLDISECPKGPRLATAGGDRKVKVWNLAAILDARVEQSSAPRLLATLEHMQPINVVRFSYDGRYLASGSDDGKVSLFELRAGAGSVLFGSKDGPSLENWKQTGSFSEHSINVTDLAWAPSSFTLATSSIDNRIVVWDASAGTRLKILTKHTSVVQGLAWDPTGKFLASISDDKSLIVWLTENWAPVATVTAPFRRAIADVFGLRFSWTPDGQMLVVVNSSTSAGPCASALLRNTWENARQFQGHRAPVVAARCSSKLFFAPSDTQGLLPLSCIAVGSKDSSLSVWSTQQADKPIAAVTDAFAHSIVDVAWTPDGYSLLASSTDGSVLVVRFDPEEVGRVLTTAEMASHMDRVYGNDRKQLGYLPPENDWCLDDGPADDHSDVDVQHTGAKANGQMANGHAEPAPPPSHTATAIPDGSEPGQPATTVTASAAAPPGARAAKRRLAPIPISASTSQPAFTTNNPPPQSATPVSGSAPQNTAAQPAAGTSTAAEAQQPATRKRIAPTEITRQAKRPSPPAQQATAAPSAATAAAAAAAPNGPAAANGPAGKPPLARQAGGAAGTAQQGTAGALPPAAASNLAGRLTGSNGVAHGFAAPSVGPTLQQAPSLQPSAAQIQAAAGQRAIAASGILPDRLGATIPADPVTVSLLGSQKQPQRTLEATNAGNMVVLIMRQDGSKAWEFRMPGQAVKLAATSSFVALGLKSGILQVLSPLGRVLLPPVQLSAAPAFLVTDEQRPTRLLAVSTSGMLRQWDTAAWQRCGCDCLAPSVSDLLTEGQTVRRMELTEAGAPLARLSDGMVWLLHPGLQAWVLVAGNESPTAAFASLLLPASPTKGGAGEGQGELARLQSRALQERSNGQQPVQACLAALGQRQADARAQERTDCEIKLVQARALASAQEFRRWLVTYSQMLARSSDEARLRELSEELLAGAESDSLETSPAQASTLLPADARQVVGWSRRKLFSKSVLQEMRRCRGTQTLATEYKDRIEQLKLTLQAAGANEQEEVLAMRRRMLAGPPTE